jgi:hypothetical protein
MSNATAFATHPSSRTKSRLMKAYLIGTIVKQTMVSSYLVQSSPISDDKKAKDKTT